MKEKTALRISTVVLFLASLMDIRRGIAHTFNVRYSAEYLAGIEPISDSLVLMGAFGISNFLTGFIYFLVIWKAKHLVPYVLLLIPFSYFIGGMGKNFQNVDMESAFVGRYIMAVYLSICMVTGLIYLLARIKTKRNMANEKV
ncbi:MAG: hypothetical protein PVH48_00185 [Cyclobacteriaceae bacterium]